MPRINEATDTDLKVIEMLQTIGWKRSDTYYQTECIQTLIQKFREKKHNMLVHMAKGLGKTRTMVAFVKALLEYDIPKIRNNNGVYTRIYSIYIHNSNGFKNNIYG